MSRKHTIHTIVYLTTISLLCVILAACGAPPAGGQTGEPETGGEQPGPVTAGQPFTTQETAAESFPAGGIGHAVLVCPPDTVLTGGGFFSNPTAKTYSQVPFENGWEAYASNSVDDTITAFAICLSNSSGSSQWVFNTVSIDAGVSGNAHVACPEGSIATGGGYASSPEMNIYTSMMFENGWDVWAYNSAAVSLPITAYAVCLSGTEATVEEIYNTTEVPMGEFGILTIACPTNAITSGGGFSISTDAKAIASRLTENGWELQTINPVGVSSVINVYAICLTFP